MTETNGARYAEISPGLQLELAISTQRYGRLAATHDEYIDEIVALTTSEMTHDIAVPGQPKKVRDALTWLMDGNITDDHFDYAVRIATRVVEPGDIELSRNSMHNKLHTPTAEWNAKARRLGSQGLHVLGINCRASALHIVEPHESFLSISDQALFTHKLASGEVRYKADPNEDPGVQLSPLPSHASIVETAYANFILKHGEAVVDIETSSSFREASERDLEPGYGPVDRLSEYRAKKEQTPAASEQDIRSLARALYRANGNILTPDLLDQLAANPHISQTAMLARLNKGSYGSESFKEDNKNLGHRLTWTSALNSNISASLRRRMQDDTEGFAANLEQEMIHVEQAVKLASKVRSILSPPETIRMDATEWNVRAR